MRFVRLVLLICPAWLAAADRFTPAPYEKQSIGGILGDRMRVNLEGRLLHVDEKASSKVSTSAPASTPGSASTPASSSTPPRTPGTSPTTRA